MSGILLPGQRPPQSDDKGSGLVLPAGYGRKREEPAPAPATPETVESTRNPETTDAGQPAAGQPANDRRQRPGQIDLEALLFPPQSAQVQCPQCGTPFTVPVFQIVDLGANPELKDALLGGQINVALCPKCGAGGQLSAPLMVHVPDKQFLGMIVPGDGRINDSQRQKMIGDLTQVLMRKLPLEGRKGYMLQPREFSDWGRFMEQMWEFEGVTPEMIRRQRAQSELVQSMMAMADDRKALEIILERNGDLVDRQFFTLLDQIFVMMLRKPGPDLQRLVQLREALLEITPAGREVAALQARGTALREQIKPDSTRAEILDLLLHESTQPDGRQVVAATISGTPGAFDYQFLMELSERLEKTTGDEKTTLESMRDQVLAVQEQLEQNRQAMMQQSQQLLQEVLSAEDLEQALRDRLEAVDELFLSALLQSIQAAERKNSMAAARRLKQVYDTAITLLQEGLPEEMQFINHLLMVSDNKVELNQFLQKNRALLTPQLLDSLRSTEAEMRETGRVELADRIKSVRATIQLKM